MKQLQKHPVKDLSPMNISDIMIMKHSPFHFEGKSAETETLMSEARIEFRKAEQSRDPGRKVNNKKKRC